jgi:hypothetical protein
MFDREETMIEHLDKDAVEKHGPTADAGWHGETISERRS